MYLNNNLVYDIVKDFIKNKQFINLVIFILCMITKFKVMFKVINFINLLNNCLIYIKAVNLNFNIFSNNHVIIMD